MQGALSYEGWLICTLGAVTGLFPQVTRNQQVPMSKFVTLLVEDDAFQREALADVLKEEGLEVVECATAEAADLIVASTGTELRALITDHNLAGEMSGAALAQYARRKHPGMNIIPCQEQT